MYKHTFYYFLGNKKYPEIYILLHYFLAEINPHFNGETQRVKVERGLQVDSFHFDFSLFAFVNQHEKSMDLDLLADFQLYFSHSVRSISLSLSSIDG